MSYNNFVSVVLPTYNHLDFLPQAIESILSQTHTNFELIIVNDGSTDGTQAFLEKLDGFDPRIRIIHQRNHGLPHALNKGFSEAKGALFTWVSSDNYYAPIFLESFVAAFAKYPQNSFAISAFAWIDEHSHIKSVHNNQRLLYRHFLHSCPGIASFMYIRDCHEQLGGYDESLFCAEDWDFWLKVVKTSRVTYVSDILCYYRRHDHSLTSSKRDTVFQKSCQVFESHFQPVLSPFNIDLLYPYYHQYQHLPDAKPSLMLDFGTLLLSSPFCPNEYSIAFLTAGLSSEKHIHIAEYNLLIAYLSIQDYKNARPLFETFKKRSASTAQLKPLIHMLEAAFSDFNQLSKLPILQLSKTSLPFLIEEEKHRDIFSITSQ